MIPRCSEQCFNLAIRNDSYFKFVQANQISGEKQHIFLLINKLIKKRQHIFLLIN